ncbi:MAG: 5-oxoprolinase subunit PxpB [Albidovulum sp.]|nr:5-oxoprolinase subunit PxpB [Albidovulum sp.]
MSPNYPRVLPCGDSALTIEFGNEIDARLNEQVIELDREVRRARLPGVIETVPTYRSLLVHLDPVNSAHADLILTLSRLARDVRPQPGKGRRWRVPVVYGGNFGEDLDALAKARGISPEQAIELHSETTYRVFMVGFMPGFTYLGGLDPRLATPRRGTPRRRIPGGSVAIGGGQTAIGSIPSPSGWHLIGRTPVRSFHPDRNPIFLFEPGDAVEFEPFPAEEWERLEAQFASGDAFPKSCA